MRGRLYSLCISDIPPSVNKATKAARVNGRLRKVSTADYAGWLEAAHWELNAQKGHDGDAYWRADILVPGRSRLDIDNHLKGILDACHKAGKTPDDRYLCDLRIRFYEGDKIVIAIQIEGIQKWAKIRNASKSLMMKLAR